MPDINVRNAKEASELLADRQEKLEKVFEEAKTESGELDFSQVKSLGVEGSVAVAEKVREMNDELTEIGKHYESLHQAEKARDGLDKPKADFQHPDVDDSPEGEQFRKEFVNLGKSVTREDVFKRWQQGQKEGVIDVPGYGLKELKATMTTSAGWAPESVRMGKLVDEPTRPVQVLDIIPAGQTGQAQIVYMEETTRTHAAAETAENAAYPEAEFVLAEQTDSVRKIGTSLPVTDEQLEDVAAVEGYINQRLTFGIRQRLDLQILEGDGIAPNLTGIRNRTGILTQARGTDPIPDAFFKAMRQIRVTGRAVPSAHVIHPQDWENIRLLRTSDGVYIWGNPSEAGPERMWGLQVVQADSLPVGTGLVGDFVNHTQLFERRGIEVKMRDTHSTDFTNGRQRIRADMRVALAVWRPAAFAEVTGL